MRRRSIQPGAVVREEEAMASTPPRPARRTALVATAAGACLLLTLVVAAPAHAATTSYTALGDSYSSGVGTRSYISDGTTCHRSSYAYPTLAASTSCAKL